MAAEVLCLSGYFAWFYMIVSCCKSRYALLPNVGACFLMMVLMLIGEF